MSPLQKHVLTLIGWSPITWIPLTLCMAGMVIVGLPWWANLLSFTLATTLVVTYWSAQVPRLHELWNIRDTEEEAKRILKARETLLSSCPTTTLRKKLQRAYCISTSIGELTKEYQALANFTFLQDSTVLESHMEELINKLVREKLTQAEVLPLIDANLTALEDTLLTCQSTLDALNTNAIATTGIAENTESILARNRVTRQALETMEPTETH